MSCHVLRRSIDVMLLLIVCNKCVTFNLLTQICHLKIFLSLRFKIIFTDMIYYAKTTPKFMTFINDLEIYVTFYLGRCENFLRK